MIQPCRGPLFSFLYVDVNVRRFALFLAQCSSNLNAPSGVPPVSCLRCILLYSYLSIFYLAEKDRRFYSSLSISRLHILDSRCPFFRSFDRQCANPFFLFSRVLRDSYVKLNLFFVYSHVMLTVVIGVISLFFSSRCYRLNLFLRCYTRIQRDRQGVDDKRRRVGAPRETDRDSA